MGISKNVRLEPYVEFGVPQREVLIDKRVACCSSYMRGSTPFCAVCGNPAQYEKVPTLKDSVESDKVRDAINERLHSPHELNSKGKHVWISNSRDSYVTPNADETTIFVVTDELIEEQKAAFAENFKKELAKMSALYGTAPTIKYGLLVWFS